MACSHAPESYSFLIFSNFPHYSLLLHTMKYIFPLSFILLFVISAQSQITWSIPIDIAPQGNGKQHPRIVTGVGGDPMVLWFNTGRAMFSRWTGSEFESPRILNPIALPVAGASWMGPDIATQGDTIYVVFKQTPEHEGHIWLMSSFDGGDAFNEPVQVDSLSEAQSRFPTVTIDDAGHPVVAFMKFDESFGDARWVVSRSYDAGKTFSPDVLASGWSSPTSDVCDCCPGSIINSADLVAMLYRDNNSDMRDSWAGLSYDGGESFSEGVNIDKHNWMISACPASGPDGVIIGDTLYSTFMNSASGKSLVYAGKLPLSDIHASFSETLLANNTGVTLQNYPRIAAYGNSMGIAWKQYSGSKERVLLRFTSDITSGFPIAIDTVDTDNIENVDIAVHDGKVYVVWEDYGAGTVKFRSGEFSTVTSVGDEFEKSNITAFPNPSVGSWTISGNFKSGMVVQLYNSKGKLVIQNKLVSDQSNFKLENTMLINGVYFLHISDYKSKYNIELIKN